MCNIFLLVIVFIETLYIIYVRYTLSLYELEKLLILFDKFIDLYGLSFVKTRIALDILAGNQVLNEEEFFKLKDDYVKYIWDRIPSGLRKKLIRIMGLNQSINYILSRIDPVLNDTYKINPNLQVEEEITTDK